jgi:predicted transcriptional regulator
LRRETSRRLRSHLGISIREVGDLMGISGSRAQQLLGK